MSTPRRLLIAAGLIAMIAGLWIGVAYPITLPSDGLTGSPVPCGTAFHPDPLPPGFSTTLTEECARVAIGNQLVGGLLSALGVIVSTGGIIMMDRPRPLNLRPTPGPLRRND